MRAINPFEILGVDEAATRDEIDAAHRRLVRVHHPDRHVDKPPEDRQVAADRVAEINYAHGLLTDPALAAAHKRTIDRVRAAGHQVDAPPRATGSEDDEEPTVARGDYRRAAAIEFTVTNRTTGTPWTARQPRRRRFGLR